MAAGRMDSMIPARQRTTLGTSTSIAFTLAAVRAPSFTMKEVVRTPIRTAAPIRVEHIIRAGPACRLMIFLCIWAVKP